VYRSIVLSIVLTLALGPSAPLLCSAWCQPLVTHACHDTDPATSLFSGADCGPAAASLQALAREDARRGLSIDGSQATLVPRYQFPPTAAFVRADRPCGRDGPLEARPLETALSI
jgi:hypothetical protein